MGQRSKGSCDSVHLKALDIQGIWFRWSAYELLNGVIVPASGATLSAYNPWDGFIQNADKYRTVQQPYVPLLELRKALDDAREKGIEPTQLRDRYFLGGPVRGPKNEADEAILKWCNQHGLLGVLPVGSNAIHMEPQILPGRWNTEQVVLTTHYSRAGGHWRSFISRMLVQGSTEEVVLQRIEALLRAEPHAGAHCFQWHTGRYELLPIDQVREFFLPTPFGNKAEMSQEPFLPPCPSSSEFWGVYGEPVSQFTGWCRLFSHAVFDMSHWTPSKAGTHNKAEKTGLLGKITDAHRFLSELAQAVAYRSEFNPKKNRLEEYRESAGLLASYALMFLWDFAEKRRVIECGNCSRYFVSNDSRAAYCSPRCRNTAQTRRYRNRKEADA